MSRNPETCPHNLIAFDRDTNEWYCEECGDVVDQPEDPGEYE